MSRKRHALVDTDGRGLVLFAHPATGPLLAASRRPFPFIEKVFADAGYQGPRVATATGFAVQPRRWVVERFFAVVAGVAATPTLASKGSVFTPHLRLCVCHHLHYQRA